jgi:hypothetical protein
MPPGMSMVDRIYCPLGLMAREMNQLSGYGSAEVSPIGTAENPLELANERGGSPGA